MTTLVHTADVHLRPDAQERLDALEAVLDAAADFRADVLTIGGDLFDRPADVETLRDDLRNRFFTDLPFEVVLIPGNPDVDAFRGDLFFGDACTVVADENHYGTWVAPDGNLRVVCIPYCETASDELLLALADRKPFDGTDVFLFHGSLDALIGADTGDEDAYRYFPVTEALLVELGFDHYLAGHYHGAHLLQFEGGAEFAYPGAPASTRSSETGRRRVVRLETGAGLAFEPLESFHHLEKRVTATPGRPEGPDYYTTLVEHLGDIHTTEIEAIREELVDEGRLTATRLNLANREYDTKDAQNRAKSIAEDVESYLETAADRGVDKAVRERLHLRKELGSVESDLETQWVAGEVADLEDARQRFEEYVAATEAVQELAGFDRGILDQLRDRKQDIVHAREQIESLETDLERQRAEADRCRERLTEARDRRAELRQREPDVERVDEALEAYRDRASRDGARFEERLAQRRYVTVAGVVGGGLAAGGGSGRLLPGRLRRVACPPPARRPGRGRGLAGAGASGAGPRRRLRDRRPGGGRAAGPGVRERSGAGRGSRQRTRGGVQAARQAGREARGRPRGGRIQGGGPRRAARGGTRRPRRRLRRRIRGPGRGEEGPRARPLGRRTRPGARGRRSRN